MKGIGRERVKMPLIQEYRRGSPSYNSMGTRGLFKNAKGSEGDRARKFRA